MTDASPTQGGPATSICPWCSASYQGAPENCPSCGATLTGEAAVDPSLPGLTAIDAAAIVRAKEPVKKSRNRLLSWISGEYEEDQPTVAEAGALAPPDLDVRREMLRLELEAEVANLQAEADAMLAEAAVEGRVSADAIAAATSEGDADIGGEAVAAADDAVADSGPAIAADDRAEDSAPA